MIHIGKPSEWTKMKTPFIRASCGCIVIPLWVKGQNLPSHIQCILIMACDGDNSNDVSFGLRDIEPHKIENGSLVDAATTLRIVERISRLIVLANESRELAQYLKSIFSSHEQLRSGGIEIITENPEEH